MNRALRELNVCANALAVEAARSLGQCFANNRTLTWLDMSCNQIGPEGGRLLRDGLEVRRQTRSPATASDRTSISSRSHCACLQTNTSLTAIDLRKNEIEAPLESAIAEALKSAEIRRQAAARA